MNDRDREFLSEAIELSHQAKNNGNEPFGALLVSKDEEILFEAENMEVTENDITGHAETNLVRKAFKRFDTKELETSTLYSSCEPCPMCAGAIYWSTIGRVVYGLGKKRLESITPDDSDTIDLPCRDILNKGTRDVVVDGPALEDKAIEPLREYYQRL